MPGVRLTAGSDLQIPAGALVISIGADGKPQMDPVVPHLRTDMWPYWLEEAIDGAVAAQQHAATVASLRAQGDEDAVTRAMVQELRGAMRAIAACAFAVDGFYAAVKARAGDHPHQEDWLKPKESGKRTPRHAQVFETLRYHLKMRNATAVPAKTRIQELFRFRGWAVHPGSRFREPVFRADVDAGVDWHFAVFRAENAVNAVSGTMNLLDVLVALMPRGTRELRGHHPSARRAMNIVFESYDRAGLPAMQRTRDSTPV